MKKKNIMQEIREEGLFSEAVESMNSKKKYKSASVLDTILMGVCIIAAVIAMGAINAMF